MQLKSSVKTPVDRMNSQRHVGFVGKVNTQGIGKAAVQSTELAIQLKRENPLNAVTPVANHI